MKITIDIMNRDDLYISTLRIEPTLSMIDGYNGDKPIVSVSELKKAIAERRPSLKDYKVLPCSDKFILNYE